MAKPKLTKLPVDVFDVEAGATRWDTVEQLLEEARGSGREAWAMFNGVMLKACPDDTRSQVDDRWILARENSLPTTR